ncbi:hypothetical protein [Bifidobacterium platyrrhinorum]|uniref:Uncharacterized protein n=1 Tax=Bifidobacterium platyrrhinorum TaxID=2661628 RepID=A0A6L9SW78_9BIFI|nr:hypothetical protein [Bifidobacterium platyrrhinorum]NEG56103.1 hypothetical protein [Bifidobacterium platyrrhinorum]
MSSLEIAVTVVVCVVGVAIGTFFGLIPLRTDRITDEQNRASQTLGLIGVGLVIVLIFTKQDLASWAAIFAMLAGVAIGKIPPLHRRALERWPWLKPKPERPAKRVKSKSGKSKSKQGRR